MIRVIAINEETGERIEMCGSRGIVVIGDGDGMQMVRLGDAEDPEVACDMLTEAHDRADEDEPVPLSQSSGATLH